MRDRSHTAVGDAELLAMARAMREGALALLDAVTADETGRSDALVDRMQRVANELGAVENMLAPQWREERMARVDVSRQPPR